MNNCDLYADNLLACVWDTVPFVKRFALCYRTVVLPVLSVTLVHCGQMVGWIKMKLSVEVSLGPGHNVLDGSQLRPPKRGKAPNFRPMSAHSAVAKRLDG